MWWVRELSRIAGVVDASREWVPSTLHEGELEQAWIALETIVEVLTGESREDIARAEAMP